MRLIALISMALLAGCASPFDLPLADENRAVFREGRITFSYPKKAYTGAKLAELPKEVSVENGFPGKVGPRRWMVTLSKVPRSSVDLAGSRYYYPASSEIFISPLKDDTVSDFTKAYPNLSSSAKSLQILLAEKDRDFSPWLSQKSSRRMPPGLPPLPDEPWPNAAQFLQAHFRKVETNYLQGFRLLCYYRQGRAGYGAINAELSYNFQGITRDGRYYISASLAIRNSGLPDSMDDPGATMDETENNYVAEQNKVNAWAEESFEPSLQELDTMIASLRVK